jgi:hypothetical protein
MKVFIDESGSFSGFHDGSISVVGMLAIPDAKIEFLTRKYQKIRVKLPLEKGEVKGRLLNENQIDQVVTLLSRNESLFEITALDLGIQTEDAALDYKKRHGEEMLARVSLFREDVRPEVEKASREILATSLPLYLQALTTFEVMHRLIGYVTMYFSQRRPSELGSFEWIVDGKDKIKVTEWEKWWSYYARGALSTMSKTRPSPILEQGDYSFYKRSFGSSEEQGTDLKLLLQNIRFCSAPEAGLEFVDILSNAVRRTLTGSLRKDGWKNIHRLMIHRKDQTYIQFVLFREGPDVIKNAPYERIVREGFSRDGKSMLTPSTNRLIDEQIRDSK